MRWAATSECLPSKGGRGRRGSYTHPNFENYQMFVRPLSPDGATWEYITYASVQGSRFSRALFVLQQLGARLNKEVNVGKLRADFVAGGRQFGWRNLFYQSVMEARNLGSRMLFRDVNWIN